jgi:hypothetical protein
MINPWFDLVLKILRYFRVKQLDDLDSDLVDILDDMWLETQRTR